MKYKMQSLKHNGIYVPQYEPKEFSVKIKGTAVKLSQKTEQMAVFWVKKEQSKTTPPDRLFYKNFMEDFVSELGKENPSLEVLKNLQVRADVDPLNDGKPREDMEVDFSEIRQYVLREQLDKQNMSKEEKKRLAQERKAKREKLKEHYGYATVDGKRIEIANWTTEPSCIFAGRGDHPKRGKWKEGPKEEDIIMNLSPDSPRPSGNWKEIVWQPEMMYIACWRDKLTDKMKYVWFSDSAFLKQDREREKFDKANKLDGEVSKVIEHIVKNLDDKDAERRKIATVCWLILEVNMRVGDEKDPEEADTVGAITLRPEHVTIRNDVLHFDFLGKDAVRWVKDVKASQTVIGNIRHLCENSKEYLFKGIDSQKVTKFLNEKMEGLTAKVFRTWKVSRTVREYLEKSTVKKDAAEYLKQHEAKLANLEAAKIANHKRKVPLNFDERLAKKEGKLRELEAQLKEKEAEGKKTDALVKRLNKARFDLELTRESKEYNLGTSLKSYIDPRVYVQWANKVEFCIDKFYSKTLRSKYSWAIKQCKFRSDGSD